MILVGMRHRGSFRHGGRRAGAGTQRCADADTTFVLKAQGSFFVGGEKVEQTRREVGDLGPGGQITVNQMYVRYMVPQGGEGNVPVAMVHGATLTGKSWETTPTVAWGGTSTSSARATRCMSPIRSDAGAQVSIKRSSTTCAPARRRRATSPAGSGSVTRSCGRTSASVRRPASPTRIASFRSPPWTSLRSREFLMSASAACPCRTRHSGRCPTSPAS